MAAGATDVQTSRRPEKGSSEDFLSDLEDERDTGSIAFSERPRSSELILYWRFCEAPGQRVVEYWSSRELHLTTANWVAADRRKVLEDTSSDHIWDGAIQMKRFGNGQAGADIYAEHEGLEKGMDPASAASALPTALDEVSNRIWRVNEQNGSSAPVELYDEWGDSAKPGGTVLVGSSGSWGTQVTTRPMAGLDFINELCWTFECWIRLLPIQSTEASITSGNSSKDWTIMSLGFTLEDSREKCTVRLSVEQGTKSNPSCGNRVGVFVTGNPNDAEERWSFVRIGCDFPKELDPGADTKNATVELETWTFVALVFTPSRSTSPCRLHVLCEENSVTFQLAASVLETSAFLQRFRRQASRLTRLQCGTFSSLPLEVAEVRLFHVERDGRSVVAEARCVLPEAILAQALLLRSLIIKDPIRVGAPDETLCCVPKVIGTSFERDRAMLRRRHRKRSEERPTLQLKCSAPTGGEARGGLTQHDDERVPRLNHAEQEDFNKGEVHALALSTVRPEPCSFLYVRNRKLAREYLNHTRLYNFYTSDFLTEVQSSIGPLLPSTSAQYPRLNPVELLSNRGFQFGSPVDPYSLLIYLNHYVRSMHQYIVASRVITAIRLLKKCLRWLHRALLSAWAVCLTVNPSRSDGPGEDQGKRDLSFGNGERWMVTHGANLFCFPEVGIELVPFVLPYCQRLFRHHRLIWMSSLKMSAPRAAWGTDCLSDAIQAHIVALSRTSVVIQLLYAALRIALRAQLMLTEYCGERKIELDDSAAKPGWSPSIDESAISVASIWEGRGWATPTQFFETLLAHQRSYSYNVLGDDGSRDAVMNVMSEFWGQFIAILFLIWALGLPYGLPTTFLQALSTAANLIDDKNLANAIGGNDLSALQRFNSRHLLNTTEDFSCTPVAPCVPLLFCYLTGRALGAYCRQTYRVPLLCPICCASHDYNTFPATLTYSNVVQRPCAVCGIGIVTLFPQEPHTTAFTACPTTNITCKGKVQSLQAYKNQVDCSSSPL